MVMEIPLSSCENNGIDSCSNNTLSELEYADDVMQLSGDPSM